MGAVVVAVVVVVVDIVVAVVVDVDAAVVQVVPIFAVSTRLNIEPELGINPKLEQVSLYNLSQLSKRSGTRQDIAPLPLENPMKFNCPNGVAEGKT